MPNPILQFLKVFFLWPLLRLLSFFRLSPRARPYTDAEMRENAIRNSWTPRNRTCCGGTGYQTGGDPKGPVLVCPFCLDIR